MTAAAGGALLLIPIWSVLTSAIVPIPLRLLVALVWSSSLLTPAIGVLALTAIAPFGSVLIRMFGTAPIQYTESLVLAAVSGLLIALGRRARADEPSPSPSIARPVLLFSAIVVSSLATLLTVSQVGLDSHRLFLSSLATFVVRDYLVSGPEPWTILGAALQLVEGLLLLALTVHWVRRDPATSSWIVTATAVAAAIAGAVNLVALVPTLRGADSIRTLATRLMSSRISIHVADLNGAGSYFAMASFVALALYERSRQSPAIRRAWALVAAVLFVALWLSGSRTAVVFVVVLIGVAIAARRTTWRERPLWPLAAGVILIAVVGALVVGFDPRAVAGRGLERSFEARAAFLTTGLRMIGSAPLFGVGVGRYVEESGRFMPQSIYWFFFRENAHNNFLQVGGELGLIGLAAFVWLIASAALRLARGCRAGSSDRLLGGAVAGLAAFVATWLSGHPLLTPEIAFPFWILTGVAIARADAHRPAHAVSQPGRDDTSAAGLRTTMIVAAAILLLAASVPFRARQEAAKLNVLDSSFGFYEWESRPGRARTRWASPSAAFFVPAETREVTIPVRTMFFDRHPEPVQVSIAIDGRLFERFELTNDAWRDVRLQLPPVASHPTQPRRIDIVTAPPWSLAQVFGAPSARALGVQLSEISTR